MTSEAQDVPERVERILSDLLARPISAAEHGSVPLRDLGLSSLRMIQLLADLESEFKIQVRDDDVVGEHFGALDGLTAYVGRRLGGQR